MRSRQGWPFQAECFGAGSATHPTGRPRPAPPPVFTARTCGEAQQCKAQAHPIHQVQYERRKEHGFVVRVSDNQQSPAVSGLHGAGGAPLAPTRSRHGGCRWRLARAPLNAPLQRKVFFCVAPAQPPPKLESHLAQAPHGQIDHHCELLSDGCKPAASALQAYAARASKRECVRPPSGCSIVTRRWVGVSEAPQGLHRQQRSACSVL